MKIKHFLYFVCVIGSGILAFYAPNFITHVGDNERADSNCYNSVSSISRIEPRLTMFITKRIQDGLLTRGECKEINQAYGNLNEQDARAADDMHLRRIYEVSNGD